jgi:hypothetical protein
MAMMNMSVETREERYGVVPRVYVKTIEDNTFSHQTRRAHFHFTTRECLQYRIGPYSILLCSGEAA